MSGVFKRNRKPDKKPKRPKRPKRPGVGALHKFMLDVAKFFGEACGR